MATNIKSQIIADIKKAVEDFEGLTADEVELLQGKYKTKKQQALIQGISLVLEDDYITISEKDDLKKRYKIQPKKLAPLQRAWVLWFEGNHDSFQNTLDELGTAYSESYWDPPLLEEKPQKRHYEEFKESFSQAFQRYRRLNFKTGNPLDKRSYPFLLSALAADRIYGLGVKDLTHDLKDIVQPQDRELTLPLTMAMVLQGDPNDEIDQVLIERFQFTEEETHLLHLAVVDEFLENPLKYGSYELDTLFRQIGYLYKKDTKDERLATRIDQLLANENLVDYLHNKPYLLEIAFDVYQKNGMFNPERAAQLFSKLVSPLSLGSYKYHSVWWKIVLVCLDEIKKTPAYYEIHKKEIDQWQSDLEFFVIASDLITGKRASIDELGTDGVNQFLQKYPEMEKKHEITPSFSVYDLDISISGAQLLPHLLKSKYFDPQTKAILIQQMYRPNLTTTVRTFLEENPDVLRALLIIILGGNFISLKTTAYLVDEDPESFMTQDYKNLFLAYEDIYRRFHELGFAIWNENEFSLSLVNSLDPLISNPVLLEYLDAIIPVDSMLSENQATPYKKPPQRGGSGYGRGAGFYGAYGDVLVFSQYQEILKERMRKRGIVENNNDVHYLLYLMYLHHTKQGTPNPVERYKKYRDYMEYAELTFIFDTEDLREYLYKETRREFYYFSNPYFDYDRPLKKGIESKE